MNENEVEQNALEASCIRQVELVAQHLRSLADRIERSSGAFSKSKPLASSTAADIVSEYTQGVGSAGSRLWALVSDASHLDVSRATKNS
jgi:hypothetical protein